MTEKSVHEIVKEFVKKFNNDEYDFAKAENHEQQKILGSLASAVNSFELADRDYTTDPMVRKLLNLSSYDLSIRKHNYDNALSDLNRLIKTAKINRLYSEHNEENNPTIKNLRNLNEKLINQKDQLQNVVDKIFEEYPKIKEKYQPLLRTIKLGEGKIE